MYILFLVWHPFFYGFILLNTLYKSKIAPLMAATPFSMIPILDRSATSTLKCFFFFFWPYWPQEITLIIIISVVGLFLFEASGSSTLGSSAVKHGKWSKESGYGVNGCSPCACGAGSCRCRPSCAFPITLSLWACSIGVPFSGLVMFVRCSNL